MLIKSFLFSLFISCTILMSFFMLGKTSKFEELQSSTFECGFTSYFYSRFCFSVHYFLISLIFLFLDLELCILLPLFSKPFSLYSLSFGLWSLVSILLGGLILEWYMGKLDWLS